MLARRSGFDWIRWRQEESTGIKRQARNPQLYILVLAAIVSGVVGVLHALGGRHLLAALLRKANDISQYHGESRWMLEQTLSRLPDLMLARGMILLWVMVLLGAFLAWLARRKVLGARGVNLTLCLATLLLFPLVLESCAAPFLIKRLGLDNFYVTLNPDHRMPPSIPAIPTNADGIRSRRESGAFTTASFNILFLGDSYTFGKKVQLEDAFPAQVEPMLRRAFPGRDVRVANFGWVTSCPLLSDRLLVEIGADYRPDLVVVCVDMTDFHDDIYYQKLLDRSGVYWFFDKFPLTLHALREYRPDTFWRFYWRLNADMPRNRFFASEQPLDESRPYLEAIRGNLVRIYRHATSMGAGLVVFILPRAYQYSADEAPRSWERNQYQVLGPHCEEPFRYFAELQPELSFPIHSVLDDFRQNEIFPTCFDDDPHWNRTGHMIAARAIARRLAKEMGGGLR